MRFLFSRKKFRFAVLFSSFFFYGSCSRGGIKTKCRSRILLDFLSFSFKPPVLQSLLCADAHWRQRGSTGAGRGGIQPGMAGDPLHPSFGGTRLPSPQSPLSFCPWCSQLPLGEGLVSLCMAPLCVAASFWAVSVVLPSLVGNTWVLIE